MRAFLSGAGTCLGVNPQRQSLGDGGLAHARLADEQRVVLAPAAQHLDAALDLGVAPDQRVDLSIGRLLHQVGGELFERLVDDLIIILAAGLAHAAGRGPPAADIDLGDAVADVVDHVEPCDSLLLQQVHRVRIPLPEHGDQQVAAGDHVALGALGVHERPLKHPLEAQGLLRPAVGVLGQDLHVFGEVLLEVEAQLAGVTPAVANDVEHPRIVEHGQKQVLEQEILVAAGPDIGHRALKGLLELRAQHYSGSMLSCSGYS